MKEKSFNLDMIGLPKDFTGTIMYGYDLDRTTVHLYAENGVLNLLTYRMNEVKSHLSGHELNINMIRPTKRVYPDRTLPEFKKYMEENEEWTTSLTSSEDAPMKKGEFGYNAKILADF